MDRVKIVVCIFVLLGVLLFSGDVLAGPKVQLGKRRDLFIIKKVVVKGIKKVEIEAIKEKISSRAGLKVDNYIIQSDIKKIYKMNFFEFVEAHSIGKGPTRILQFVVKEKPIVSKILIEGNDGIDDDELKEQLDTKPFSILDINKIKNDLDKLQKHYEEKGFYLASVTYSLKKINRENLELHFNVKEFQKVKIKKITFLGNKAFADEELKDIMETREDSFFSALSGSGSFKEFSFQTDIEKLKYFYRTKGYLQVNMGVPEVTVSEDKKWVFITAKINEGPQFSVNDITFQGEVLFKAAELNKKIKLKKGAIYSEALLRMDIQLLTEMYQDKGYAFANVLRNLRIVPGENKVNIEFSFEKGKIAYFGKITVKGNTKTRDKVVRRELKIREGQRFTGTGLRKSKENVNRLGFFEPGSVLFNTVSPRGRDDLLDVEISVKERNTGQISLGAGYSTASKEFIQASIAQTNFLGYGQNLSFSFSHSNTTQTFNLGFTDPYFLDSKWTLGGDVYRTNNSASSAFSYRKLGFNARVGYPIAEYTRLYGVYKLEKTTITEQADTTIDKSQEDGIASGVEFTLLRDRRNNRFEPSSGYYTSVSLEYTGLGGDKRWLKSNLDGRYFHKIIGDLVFRSRLNVAKLNKVDGRPVPRTEKFTLGGSRNLRGYGYDAIGPKRVVDITATDGTVVTRTFNDGGLFMVNSSIELEHPLAREAGLKWVLFVDGGNVYDKYMGKDDNYQLFGDYGFGFRWFSPIGVLRFEYGYPMSGNGGGQFHFDIGQLF
jgi:outer membrane protein insertion porin family